MYKESYCEFGVGFDDQLCKPIYQMGFSPDGRFGGEEDGTKIYDYQSNIGTFLATHFSDTKKGLYKRWGNRRGAWT